jgi:hypothetical protein
MSRKTHILPLFLLFSVVIITSCVPDEFNKKYNFDVLWEPYYNGPAAFGNFTLKDILDKMIDTAELELDVEIDEDSTNLYYVAYSDHIKSIRGDEWIEIPDQNFPNVYFYRPEADIPAAVLGNIGDTIYKIKIEKFDFVTEHNERIDSIFLTAGNLNTNTFSTLHHTGWLIIHSDQIKMGDEFYRDSIIISDASGNFSDSKVTPLDGSVLRLDNQSDPDTTFLEIIFELYLIHSGNDINAGEEVNVDMTFTDLIFQSAYGSFGDYDTLLIDNERFEFEMFEYKFGGNVYFGDPRINLIVDNSFGIPLSVNLFNLSAYSQKTGIETDINFISGVNPFKIPAPALSQLGQSVDTVISINKTNSNIDDVTNTTLSYIDYSARLITNPEGIVAQDNFVLDSSRASVDFEVVLPMDLRAEDFELEDTVDFDLTEVLDENADFKIDTFQIRMETTNWMPVDINMQVVLVDSSYNILDSLFRDGAKLIIGTDTAKVDSVSGKVLDETTIDFLIDFLPEQLDKIRNTKYAMVRGTFETAYSGQTMVKFYSYSEFSFKLGTKIAIRITQTQ